MEMREDRWDEKQLLEMTVWLELLNRVERSRRVVTRQRRIRAQGGVELTEWHKLPLAEMICLGGREGSLCVDNEGENKIQVKCV